MYMPVLGGDVPGLPAADSKLYMVAVRHMPEGPSLRLLGFSRAPNAGVSGSVATGMPWPWASGHDAMCGEKGLFRIYLSCNGNNSSALLGPQYCTHSPCSLS